MPWAPQFEHEHEAASHWHDLPSLAQAHCPWLSREQGISSFRSHRDGDASSLDRVLRLARALGVLVSTIVALLAGARAGLTLDNGGRRGGEVGEGGSRARQQSRAKSTVHAKRGPVKAFDVGGMNIEGRRGWRKRTSERGPNGIESEDDHSRCSCRRWCTSCTGRGTRPGSRSERGRHVRVG